MRIAQSKSVILIQNYKYFTNTQIITMDKTKARKIIIAGGATLFLLAVMAVSNRVYIKTVLADDNEFDSEDVPPATSSPAKVIDTSPSNNTAQKTEYVTVYKKLNDTVTTKTDTITRHDSDGDGLYDDEDPHPTINEYFIVKDDNLNGIDDRYEQ